MLRGWARTQPPGELRAHLDLVERLRAVQRLRVRVGCPELHALLGDSTGRLWETGQTVSQGLISRGMAEPSWGWIFGLSCSDSAPKTEQFRIDYLPTPTPSPLGTTALICLPSCGVPPLSSAQDDVLQATIAFAQHLQAAANHAVDGVVASSAHTDYLDPGIATCDSAA